MRLYIPLAIFAAANCGRDPLHRICDPTPCYTGPMHKAEVGVCRMGHNVCDEDMNIVGCEGQILPSDEICDGLDNDCNGMVDDDTRTLEVPLFRGYWEPENTCPKQGQCSAIIEICDKGEWRCAYEKIAHIELPEEKSCDGRDNDCDGIVDEGTVAPEFCYTYPDVLTATNPPCRAGVRSCVKGVVECVGQVTPVPEFCDGQDNDCNGVRDDTDGTLNHKLDIVFAIDNSGSMCPYIGAVVGACNHYAELYREDPKWRFAIVIINDLFYPYVKKVLDFGTVEEIRTYLSSLGCNGGAKEASIDASYMICDKDNSLELSWRDDATRVIYMLTDEMAQSYTDPGTTIEQAVGKCRETGTTAFVWGSDFRGLEVLATDTGGWVYNLSTDWYTVFSQMNSIVLMYCVD